MRRYFFRPTFWKLMASFFLTISTFYLTSIETILPDEILRAKFFVQIGAATAYIAIGPTNPILKFGAIFLFWFAVSWVVYLVVWLLEYLYVKIYNLALIKIKFTK